MRQALVLCVLALSLASATVYFKETFDDSWEDRWVTSNWKKSEGTAGKWAHEAGDWYGDAEKDKGIQTSQDARFYAISSKIPTEFSNEGKTLVLQFSVKHAQSLDCGGGYIKLIPAGLDQENFQGNSDYSIMFGPDMCGTTTKKVHVIITYKGKNHLIKKDIKCETDQLTHVYTLILNPDQTYEVRIDGVKKESGSLLEDWDFLAPKMIKDPNQKKPKDWVDEATIEDPNEVKPDGWDDIPKKIPDPEAEKPSDWDDEADGEWEAPMLDNPEYKGEWKAKKIPNPEYKGAWVHPEIENPEYVADDKIYAFPSIGFVGFELWQVKSGSIFDNIIVTDDVEESEEFLAETFTASKDAEKSMFDQHEKEKREKEEAERKAREAAAKEKEAEEEAEEEEEDDEEVEEEEEEEVAEEAPKEKTEL